MTLAVLRLDAKAVESPLVEVELIVLVLPDERSLEREDHAEVLQVERVRVVAPEHEEVRAVDQHLVQDLLHHVHLPGHLA